MSGEPGLRERKKLETREHLATTAVRLFVERGFEAVSVAEVAEAAGVSKMTVFNHFAAKEDLVLEVSRGVGRGMPDLAGAVRRRREGEAPLAAIRREVEQDFVDEGRQGLSDAMAPFVRMVFRSPTLMHAFGRRWAVVQQALAVELAQLTGTTPPPDDLELRFFEAIRGDVDPDELGRWVDSIRGASLAPHLAAGQIVATLQQLTMANLVRRVAGVTPAEASARSLEELDLAFELLGSGLGDFAA